MHPARRRTAARSRARRRWARRAFRERSGRRDTAPRAERPPRARRSERRNRRTCRESRRLSAGVPVRIRSSAAVPLVATLPMTDRPVRRAKSSTTISAKAVGIRGKWLRQMNAGDLPVSCGAVLPGGSRRHQSPGPFGRSSARRRRAARCSRARRDGDWGDPSRSPLAPSCRAYCCRCLRTSPRPAPRRCQRRPTR